MTVTCRRLCLILAQDSAVFEPVPSEVGSLYFYQPLLVETHGPGVPDLEELESYGYKILPCFFSN